MTRLTDALAIFLESQVPVAFVVALSLLPTLGQQLAVLSVTSLTFSVLLTVLSSAKMPEIFAINIALLAVLVAFVANSSVPLRSECGTAAESDRRS